MIDFSKTVNFIRELYHQPTNFIPLHAPVFNGNEKEYLKECIDSTFVSSVGKFVDQFEVEIAKYTGAKKAIACVNGTSALHLALKLVGVEPGNEVITQPLTFIATANAITYCGAQPVFLDVDIDTMGLSPAKLKAWLKQNVILKNPELSTLNSQLSTLNAQPFNLNTGHRISACLPVHTFGHPCRIDEIIEICNQYNIPVVEDAAESLGSFYKKRHTGTFGKIGVLSFNGNKILTTGGGGMLLFQDELLAKRAKHLTTQAKIPHPWEFFHDEIGYNYRMPNINAALGLAQLEQLPTFLQSKRMIAEAYKSFFSTLTSTSVFISEPPAAHSNYWLNCIQLNNKKERDALLKYTNEKGVMTRPTWKLMNNLIMFKDCKAGELTNATDFANRLVNLPSSIIV
jgi:perosamine synthetase